MGNTDQECYKGFSINTVIVFHHHLLPQVHAAKALAPLKTMASLLFWARLNYFHADQDIEELIL